jgi:hypothetical protein
LFSREGKARKCQIRFVMQPLQNLPLCSSTIKTVLFLSLSFFSPWQKQDRLGLYTVNNWFRFARNALRNISAQYYRPQISTGTGPVGRVMEPCLTTATTKVLSSTVLVYSFSMQNPVQGTHIQYMYVLVTVGVPIWSNKCLMMGWTCKKLC